MLSVTISIIPPLLLVNSLILTNHEHAALPPSKEALNFAAKLSETIAQPVFGLVPPPPGRTAYLRPSNISASLMNNR